MLAPEGAQEFLLVHKPTDNQLRSIRLDLQPTYIEATRIVMLLLMFSHNKLLKIHEHQQASTRQRRMRRSHWDTRLHIEIEQQQALSFQFGVNFELILHSHSSHVDGGRQP